MTLDDAERAALFWEPDHGRYKRRHFFALGYRAGAASIGAVEITAWHGTSVEIAAVIQREGFKPDCWFALDPRYSLLYGGPVLLGVRFAVGGIPRDDAHPWQFHHLDAIPPDRIVATLVEPYEVSM